MNKETGGPAFPLLAEQTDDGWAWPSMTLRDYFAAKAMQGYCSNQEHCRNCTIEMTAEASYEVADAMLKARGEA